MVTLKEIAEKCSVSITTVSNILNGKSNVSEKTKERVLKIIKETGYHPNYMARGLRAAKTNSVGIIIDDLTEFSSPGIIDGIMSYFDEHKYKAILENLRFYSKWGTKWYHNKGYEESVQQAIDEFESIKVDGIIYVAGHARCISCIPDNLNVPLVISYAFTEKKGISSVEFDDMKAAYDLTKHLIENGHKKIAVIAGTKNNIHTGRRLEGFKKAMKENALPVKDSDIKYAAWDTPSGYENAKLLLEDSDYTAVFCFNDLMAAGVYDYLYEKKLVPGKDISVAGYDNRTMSRYLKPALTTVEIPLYDIGRKSAELILKQINNEDDSEQQQSFVQCGIIERESVGKI
ncbi:transcriptional regulator, LacI family [Treponema bryantii]|uniref:Transcriptional regulator, LacI family n=1 Tax=Treponema bryantii TaxID=163 RepID=A0A1H9C5E9_9SPIR|nr:LacI family DNA-binding transcriptional regulator [Treponema bryantii]BDC92550.1 LacI family transcriptional regulator [Treponema bryantii]SEP96352.1 transcriptional regulator, LacI family [Treponema bryantii]